MKLLQARALAQDALHQVLDNRVFRVMVALAALPPLFAALVAFRPEEIVVLFGWKHVSYSVLGVPRGIEDPRSLAIEQFLRLIFDRGAGPLGVLVCLIATASFVPHIVEKGTADVLFHKPLSRASLYLSRYGTGLLFVGLLALFMAVGTWAGLALGSGHNDPGILLGAFTLTYGYGLTFAVTMLFGALTRNAIAAVLGSLIFLFLNGCIVHPAWTWKESWRDTSAAAAPDEAVRSDPQAGLDTGVYAAAVLCDVLHHALPKTGDAPLIARELRRDPSAFRDADSGLCISHLPEGARKEAAPAETLPPAAAAALGPPRLAIVLAAEDARVTLRRRERPQPGEKGGVSTLDVARELADLLAERDPRRRSGHIGAETPLATSEVRWSEEARDRSVILFRLHEWIYALETDLPGSLADEARAALLARLTADLDSDARSSGGLPGSDWYERRASFSAPWKLNLAYSIASSLAFVAVVLALGCARLARTDF